MSFAEFQQAIARDAQPGSEWTGAVRALWYDARGDWEKAHDGAQEDHTHAGSWVHAYLHRKEGDLGNAGYWYARAGQPMPAAGVTLETEWAAIVRELVGK